jgi:hypothetical protein
LSAIFLTISLISTVPQMNWWKWWEWDVVKIQIWQEMKRVKEPQWGVQAS